MSNIERERESNGSQERDDREAIGQLLRLAGPRPNVPTNTTERVQAATRDEWRAVVGARRRRVYLVAAAGLAAAAALFVLWPQASRDPVPEVMPRVEVARLQNATGTILLSNDEGEPRILPVGADVHADDRLETGPRARAALEMSRGGSLRLDRNTRLRLLGDRRLILERGAVYVDSDGMELGSDSVEIRTEYGVVTHVGTQFQTHYDDDRLQVQVREGEVVVSSGSESHQVGVGVALRLSASGELERHEIPVYGPAWDWILEVAPAFTLEGETLESFLNWITRETGWQLVFASDAVADSAPGVILSGSISGMRPDQALSAVLPTCRLSHRISDGILLIEPETP